MTLYIGIYDPQDHCCTDGGLLHDWRISDNPDGAWTHNASERVGVCVKCGLNIRGRREPNRDGEALTFQWYSEFAEDDDTVVLLHGLGVVW